MKWARLGASSTEAVTFWHYESGSSVALGVHGTPNCCYEHVNQNL